MGDPVDDLTPSDEQDAVRVINILAAALREHMPTPTQMMPTEAPPIELPPDVPEGGRWFRGQVNTWDLMIDIATAFFTIAQASSGIPTSEIEKLLNTVRRNITADAAAELLAAATSVLSEELRALGKSAAAQAKRSAS